MSLDNLANASIQKYATINSLVATNTQLTQALESIQATTACMYPLRQVPSYLVQGLPAVWVPTPPARPPAPQISIPPPPPARTLGPRPTHWGVIKPNCWDRNRYCWTHRSKVKSRHNGATCLSRQATSLNIMGGTCISEGYPGPTLIPATPPVPPT
jgi:hypothetical protein